jgi:FKBP-type peptidyl-prolyl cis-trans isomerase
MDAKKMPKEDMKMSEMTKDPHHLVAMAYHQSALTFAKSLRDMAAGAKIEDLNLARTVFAEIKRNLDKMDEIHRSHLDSMSQEMRNKMRSMMDKMQAQMTGMKEQLNALEKSLTSDSPNAKDVHTYASELVMELSKMGAGS